MGDARTGNTKTIWMAAMKRRLVERGMAKRVREREGERHIEREGEIDTYREGERHIERE